MIFFLSFQMNQESGGRILTKSSKLNTTREEFKVISHTKIPKKTMKDTQVRDDGNQLNNLSADIDMKKARFEVYKFSKSNLNFSNRQNSNVELAIQLGAKPPKNKYINYKSLIEQRQQELDLKNKEKFCEQINQSFRNKILSKQSNNSKSSKMKSKERNILGVYGKVNIKINFMIKCSNSSDYPCTRTSLREICSQNQSFKANIYS